MNIFQEKSNTSSSKQGHHHQISLEDADTDNVELCPSRA